MPSTAGGLQCSHGSDLDTRIPRAKLPKRALPDCLRKKIKGATVDENSDNGSDAFYKAGAGVLAPVGSAPDGTFLKRGSGKPASMRASALAQMSGESAHAKAVIRRSRLANGEGAALELPQGRRDSHREFKYSNSNSTCAATKRATTTNPAASAKAQTAPQPTSSRATPIGRRSKQDKSSSSSRRSSRRKNNGTVSGGSTYGTRRSTNDITNTSSGSGNRRAPNARRASAGDRVDFAEVSLPPIGRNPLQSSTALATVDRSPVRRSPLRCYGADKGEEEYDDDDGDDDDEIEPPRFRALQVAPNSEGDQGGGGGQYEATSTYDPFSDDLRGGLNPSSSSSSRGVKEHGENGDHARRRMKKKTDARLAEEDQEDQSGEINGEAGEAGEAGEPYGPAPFNHHSSSSTSSSPPSFEASSTWHGSVPNMVFKTGTHGTGYYLDSPPPSATTSTSVGITQQQQPPRQQSKQEHSKSNRSKNHKKSSPNSSNNSYQDTNSTSGKSNASVTMSRAQYAAELTELLEEFAPNKVDNAAALLRKHRGREQDLIEKVRAKYGVANLR